MHTGGEHAYSLPINRRWETLISAYQSEQEEEGDDANENDGHSSREITKRTVLRGCGGSCEDNVCQGCKYACTCLWKGCRRRRGGFVQVVERLCVCVCVGGGGGGGGGGWLNGKQMIDGCSQALPTCPLMTMEVYFIGKTPANPKVLLWNMEEATVE